MCSNPSLEGVEKYSANKRKSIEKCRSIFKKVQHLLITGNREIIKAQKYTYQHIVTKHKYMLWQKYKEKLKKYERKQLKKPDERSPRSIKLF